MQFQAAKNSVLIAPPERGKMISLGGSQHNFKLVSNDTGGQLALMEATILPGVLVVPHTHTHEDELLIVQNGEIGIRAGDQEFYAPPGSYVFIPRGTAHAFWNSSNVPITGISLFTPAGLEGYFEQMGAVFQASNPPDFAKLGAIGHQFGIVTDMTWVPELSAKYKVSLR